MSYNSQGLSCVATVFHRPARSALFPSCSQAKNARLLFAASSHTTATCGRDDIGRSARWAAAEANTATITAVGGILRGLGFFLFVAQQLMQGRRTAQCFCSTFPAG